MVKCALGSIGIWPSFFPMETEILYHIQTCQAAFFRHHFPQSSDSKPNLSSAYIHLCFLTNFKSRMVPLFDPNRQMHAMGRSLAIFKSLAVRSLSRVFLQINKITKLSTSYASQQDNPSRIVAANFLEMPAGSCVRPQRVSKCTTRHAQADHVVHISHLYRLHHIAPIIQPSLSLLTSETGSSAAITCMYYGGNIVVGEMNHVFLFLKKDIYISVRGMPRPLFYLLDCCTSNCFLQLIIYSFVSCSCKLKYGDNPFGFHIQ